MDNKISYQQLWQSLTPLYDEGEAKAVVRMLLEEAFGLTFTDICCGKVEALSADDRQRLEALMARLRQGEPVQYVLGEACFCGRRFRVAPGVLIPRPETEDLCRTVKSYHNTPFCALQPPAPLQVLDVGTGSGCIAVTLALDLFNAEVTAWDVSGDALVIARDNAHRLGAKVNFEWHDILDTQEDDRQWDIIVSNPPYIARRERAEMSPHVLDHEPELALFVPDDDPLLFYRAIGSYAARTLKAGGWLYFEINPLYAEELREMLTQLGFGQVLLQKDSFGKLRFCKANVLFKTPRR
jgi:release factor glutamine methyltransferase